METNRVEWVDNAKGIAIICVVLGHFCITDWLTTIIYTFHMPLFFFISGLYLTKNIDKKKFIPFLRKKISRLLIPYVFFSFLILFFYMLMTSYTDILPNCKNINYFNSFLNIFFELKRSTLVRCHLWFLTSLFVSNIIVWLVCKYLKLIYQFFAIVVISVIAFIYNYYCRHTTVFFLDVSMIACLFVYIGICYNKYINKYSILLLGLFLLIYLLSSYANYFIMNKSNVDMYNAKYGNYLLFVLSSFTGSFLVIMISHSLKLKLLSEIGRNSLVIYCLHFIPLLICLHYIDEMNSIGTLGTLLVKLVCSILTILIIQIIKPIFSLYLPWAIGETS